MDEGGHRPTNQRYTHYGGKRGCAGFLNNRFSGAARPAVARTVVPPPQGSARRFPAGPPGSVAAPAVPVVVPAPVGAHPRSRETIVAPVDKRPFQGQIGQRAKRVSSAGR